MFTTAIAALVVSLAATIGAPTVTDGVDVRVVPRHLERYVVDCPDPLGHPVYVDVATRSLYGDQDGDGRINGDDCNWR